MLLSTMGMIVALMLSAAPQNVHLLPTELALLPDVQHVALASPGGRFGAIRQLVAGCVLLVIAGVFIGPGAYLLTRAREQTDPTALLAVGWSLTGFGLLFAAVGLPFFIIGIVRNAMMNGESSD
jgi:hypothetical protein